MTSDPVEAEACTALGAAQQRLESHPSRELRLGELQASRPLPVHWEARRRFGDVRAHEGPRRR